MSRSVVSGAELRDTLAIVNTSPDGLLGNAPGTGAKPTIDTTIPRAPGLACWKCAPGAAGGTSWIEFADPGILTNDYYLHVAFRFENQAETDIQSVFARYTRLASSLSSLQVDTASAGSFTVRANAGPTPMAPSHALDYGVWHYAILRQQITAGSGADDITECWVDGAHIDLVTATIASAAHDAIRVGYSASQAVANKIVYIDDVILSIDDGNFDVLSNLMSRNVILLRPVSDAQVGSWTGGAGGLTNLFDAVDNTPPAGTATETNTTQIESIDSSGDNATDEYRANLTSWATAGVGPNDAIICIIPLINHGEDVATGTKTGSFGLQANPVTTYQSFTFGADVGALATYPTNWTWSTGGPSNTPINYPSINKSQTTVIAVRKTDTGTRVASVDFMGVMVEIAKRGSPSPLIHSEKMSQSRNW